MDDDVAAVVIENGSAMTKAGFAGQDSPRVVFPTVLCAGNEGESYIGNSAQSKRGVHVLKHPIERGTITDWDAMERIWHHTFFDQLRVAPEEQPVLLACAATRDSEKTRIAQAMFETFGVPALYLAAQAPLALYAAGRTTGVVLDSGEGSTRVVPVYEGTCLSATCASVNLAGGDLTRYLARLLGTDLDAETVCSLKERLCYVALDFEKEDAVIESQKASRYELPDGQTITIGRERFRCPEALFRPALLGVDSPGIHDMIYSAIMDCEIADIRSVLYNNIVLAGGTTLFPGIAARLRAEIVRLAPSCTMVKVVAPPERRCTVWIGGSILASLSQFNDMWCSRQEYDEIGPGIVRRKFF